MSRWTCPPELRSLPQWVVWRFGQRRSEGRRAKVPYDPRTGGPAAVNDPNTWAPFGQAVAVADQYDGIGIVLTADSPFTGLDLDHCRDPESGAIAAWAQGIVDTLASYTEITPSGTGLRVFVRATLPRGGRKRGPIEMYDRAHFLTITGAHLQGSPMTIEARQREVDQVHAEAFGPSEFFLPHPVVWPLGFPASQAVSSRQLRHDRRLLERAARASNGRLFVALWGGELAGYPSHSEADLALLNLLAFWTGHDPVRMDRMFRQSCRYRSKWDDRRGAETYGALTLARALREAKGHTTGWWGRGRRIPS
jgi:putative DNA primase/helicase